jgi:hypothetical protein
LVTTTGQNEAVGTRRSRRPGLLGPRGAPLFQKTATCSR